MFRTTELVTDHGITKIGDTRLVQLEVDDIKINLYTKELNGIPTRGIDVFKLSVDSTDAYKHWESVFSEWVD